MPATVGSASSPERHARPRRDGAASGPKPRAREASPRRDGAASGPKPRAREASPRPRARIALAALALLALGLAAAPSCTTALGLDSYASAPGSLCDKLDVCYVDGALPQCEERVAASLAGSPMDNTWLESFSQDLCLSSCASARRCLDLQPVCANVGQTCKRREECCGFTSGQADCVAGVCCTTAGVHCGSTSECCFNAGDCLATSADDPNKKTCNGTICRTPGLPCSIDAQCCTGICQAGACAQFICNDDGFECKADTDCCSGHCDETHVCGNQCAAEGYACKKDSDCCNGVPCFIPAGSTDGVCSKKMCLPNNVACAPAVGCCSGYCDPTYLVCATQCTQAGAACTMDGDCCTGSCEKGLCATKCSDAYCSTDAECCSGTCVAGTCALPCGATACHSVCEQGPPLPQAGASDAGTSAGCANVPVACINTVCNKDPYCCCNAWDAICVADVLGAAVDSTSGCAGICP